MSRGGGSGSQSFSPRLDVLPGPQRRLWDELSATPAPFVLYGGTAVALHLGHRSSVDFDFFAFEPIDPGVVLRSVPYLAGGLVRQSAPSTLSVEVDRDGPVKVSFLGLPHMKAVCPPLDAAGLAVASLIDLAATKVEVVQRRAEAKDYIDVAAMLGTKRIDLPLALAAARFVHGDAFAAEASLKALCYFGDGDLASIQKADRDLLVAAVADVDLRRLPSAIDVVARCVDGGGL